MRVLPPGKDFFLSSAWRRCFGTIETRLLSFCERFLFLGRKKTIPPLGLEHVEWDRFGRVPFLFVERVSR